MASPCDESWVGLEEASGHTDVAFPVNVNKTGSSVVTLTKREGEAQVLRAGNGWRDG